MSRTLAVTEAEILEMDPKDLLEDVAALRFPRSTDIRLQALMDRNNEGTLAPDEQEQLKALVDMSETISLLRAKALHLLGRQPQ